MTEAYIIFLMNKIGISNLKWSFPDGEFNPVILDTKMVSKYYAPSPPGDMTVISKMAVI